DFCSAACTIGNRDRRGSHAILPVDHRKPCSRGLRRSRLPTRRGRSAHRIVHCCNTCRYSARPTVRTGLTATHRASATGAPTSPALANLVARTFDIRSSALAQANWLAYTRYADDLAFSGIEIADVGTLLWTIKQIAQDEGFDVHPRKIKVMRPHRRQHLTGLVINDQPSYPRDDYDRLRALLHNAANTSAQEQNRAGVEHFRAHIYGRIAHISGTSTTRRRTLLRLAERVDWDD
ncbi:MAG: hypothetical protein ABS976_05350, partial [Rhodococcus sp. (in: high G+C Gram-positive bacteria)]